MREGCFELYRLWTLFSVLSTRLTSSDFNYHAIRKKMHYYCAIQSARLVWKQKIWLAICELFCSLTNQNACFITFFCIQLPLFCTVLRKNCTVLSQSESSNFFMYIINPKSIILDQMTNLNMIFHVVVSVYRLVKIWNSPRFPDEFRNSPIAPVTIRFDCCTAFREETT